MRHFALATDQEIRTELGTRLRAQRLAQALSQEELAARAGVSLSTLKRLEKSADTSFEAFVRVAMALGMATQFETLFNVEIKSIAQMEQIAATYQARVRAPRKSRRQSTPAAESAPQLTIKFPSP